MSGRKTSGSRLYVKGVVASFKRCVERARGAKRGDSSSPLSLLDCVALAPAGAPPRVWGARAPHARATSCALMLPPGRSGGRVVALPAPPFVLLLAFSPFATILPRPRIPARAPSPPPPRPHLCSSEPLTCPSSRARSNRPALNARSRAARLPPLPSPPHPSPPPSTPLPPSRALTACPHCALTACPHRPLSLPLSLAAGRSATR